MAADEELPDTKPPGQQSIANLLTNLRALPRSQASRRIFDIGKHSIASRKLPQGREGISLSSSRWRRGQESAAKDATCINRSSGIFFYLALLLRLPASTEAARSRGRPWIAGGTVDCHEHVGSQRGAPWGTSGSPGRSLSALFG